MCQKKEYWHSGWSKWPLPSTYTILLQNLMCCFGWRVAEKLRDAEGGQESCLRISTLQNCHFVEQPLHSMQGLGVDVTKRGWRAILDSEVRAVAALQIQRHQLSIKIFKGGLLHVILFIFLLPYTGEWIHFTQNDMHINKQICKEIQDSKVQRQGKRDKKKEMEQIRQGTRRVSGQWSLYDKIENTKTSRRLLSR